MQRLRLISFKIRYLDAYGYEKHEF